MAPRFQQAYWWPQLVLWYYITCTMCSTILTVIGKSLSDIRLDTTKPLVSREACLVCNRTEAVGLMAFLRRGTMDTGMYHIVLSNLFTPYKRGKGNCNIHQRNHPLRPQATQSNEDGDYIHGIDPCGWDICTHLHGLSFSMKLNRTGLMRYLYRCTTLVLSQYGAQYDYLLWKHIERRICFIGQPYVNKPFL